MIIRAPCRAEFFISLERLAMIIALLLMVIFLAFVVLLYKKRIAAMLALPVMALLFAVTANVPRDYILEKILEEGPLRFGPAIMAAIFGGMLALFIKNQGIAEGLVRYAAELGGERPLALAFSMMMVTALLFTLLGGLGTVIMVGSIILPIMLSVGIAPLTAACIMLLGLAMGGMLNLGNWQLYISVLGLEQAQVREFMVIVFGLFFVVGTLFCVLSLRRTKLHRFWPAPSETATITVPALRRLALLAPLTPLACALFLHWPIVPSFIVGLLFTLLVSSQQGQVAVLSLLVLLANVTGAAKFFPALHATHTGPATGVFEAAIYGFLVLLPFILWTAVAIWYASKRLTSWRTNLALLTPLVPLFLIHLLHWDIIAAFITGMLLAIVVTVRHETIQIFTKSVLEGFESVGPPVILIIGIGILYATVEHPNIRSALQPFITRLTPSSATAFVIIFGLLAPLALYRGPLNIWGMGSGFAGIMLAAGALPPEAIMAVLASLGAIQGVCDPTNTHNVWIASFNKVDTLDILKRTIIFIWPMAVVALAIAAMIYFK